MSSGATGRSHVGFVLGALLTDMAVGQLLDVTGFSDVLVRYRTLSPDRNPSPPG